MLPFPPLYTMSKIFYFNPNNTFSQAVKKLNYELISIQLIQSICLKIHKTLSEFLAILLDGFSSHWNYLSKLQVNIKISILLIFFKKYSFDNNFWVFSIFSWLDCVYWNIFSFIRRFTGIFLSIYSSRRKQFSSSPKYTCLLLLDSKLSGIGKISYFILPLQLSTECIILEKAYFPVYFNAIPEVTTIALYIWYDRIMVSFTFCFGGIHKFKTLKNAFNAIGKHFSRNVTNV